MPDSGAYITVKGTNGVVKTVTLYTTLADVTEVYKEFIYKGNVVYACTTTDPEYELATEYRYLDTDGVVRYLCERNPIPYKSGNIIIMGDLTTDLVVDGNLEVYGNISSNAVASGSISYGSLTGSISQGAEFTSCDIFSEDGTLTFDESVSKKNGVFYTTGTVTNASGTTTHFYLDLTVETTSRYALYNNKGTLTIDKGSNINLISTNSDGSKYGIYNSNGTFTIGGTVTSTVNGSYGYGVYSNNEFTVSGSLTVVATGSSGYGIYNSSSLFTVEDGGSINVTSNEYYGIYNTSGTFTIEVKGTAKTTGYRSIYNSNKSEFIVKGTLTSTGDSSKYGGPGIYNSSNSIFTIESGGVAEVTGYRGIYNYSSELTIKGTLTTTGTGTDINGSGIYNDSATLTIENDGIFKATGYRGVSNSGAEVTVKGFLIGQASSNSNHSNYGIFNNTNSVFTVETGGTVEATGFRGMYNSSEITVKGSLTATGSNEILNSYHGLGIYCSGSTITIESGGVAAVNGCGGIYGSSSEFIVKGTLTATGSNEFFKHNDDNTVSLGYGIFDNYNSSFTIETGGIFTATGCRGIDTEFSKFVVKGTLTTTGSNVDEANGIFNNDNSTFTIEAGGVVTATGHRGVENYQSSNFTVKGNLKATSTGSDYNSPAIFNDDNSTFTIETGGVVTSTGYRSFDNYQSSTFIVKGSLTTTSTGTDYNGIGLFDSNSSTVTIETGGVVDSTGYMGVALQSSSDLTVAGTLTATTTLTAPDAFALEVHGNSTVTVSGTLYTIAPATWGCTYTYDGGSIKTTGSGKIYKNGVLS